MPEADSQLELDPGAHYRSVWRHLMTTEFCQGYVQAAGLRTRYIEAGSPSDPALVMLHGTGGHWETFCATIPVFAAHFHCYAFDMFGCGFTDKPDQPYEIKEYVGHALAFMDAMAIERASLIGVSLGSWVACRLALDAPGRVDKMVLNSPAGLLPLAASAGQAVKNRQDSGADPSWDNVARVLAHLFFDRATLIDDLVAIRQQVYSLPDVGHLMGRMLTLMDPEVRARNLLTTTEWASITAPTLAIAHVDAPDDYLTTARRIVELMPNATLAEIHNASHWPHFEQPDAFNAVALNFLRGAQAPGSS